MNFQRKLACVFIKRSACLVTWVFASEICKNAKNVKPTIVGVAALDYNLGKLFPKEIELNV